MSLLDFWAGMTGTVLDFAGTAAPNGWLLCYGQTVSRTTYAGLFAAIGTTFGTGDGSTTFVLPDCRGRVHAGKDDMGGTAASRLTTAGSSVDGATLGASGGAETHTLTAAEMPAHTHANTLSDPTHAHANTLTDPTHAHPYQAANAGAGNAAGNPGGYANASTTSPAATGITINNAGAATGITINNVSAGTGDAHANVQPSIVFNKIIKT